LKFSPPSPAVAKRQNEEYEYAQSNLLRARLAHQLGLPQAEPEIASAEAELDKFERMTRQVVQDRQNTITTAG